MPNMRPGYQASNRRSNQPRMKITTVFGMLSLLGSLFICGSYFLYNNSENESQCLSELANAKNQLDNVLGYKKTMDYLMSKIQGECSMQKQMIKYYSDIYLLMKHHLKVCEMHADELQVESKGLIAILKKTKADLVACNKAPG